MRRGYTQVMGNEGGGGGGCVGVVMGNGEGVLVALGQCE